MAKLDYRGSPPDQSSSGDVQLSEFLIPLILVVVGLLIDGIKPFFTDGTKSAALAMGLVFLIAAAQTVLGIGAAYITASMLGTSFGELRTAFLKLAAVIIFSGAIGSIIPFGGLIVLFVYFGLLIWLFGLEVYEAVVFAFIFAIVQYAVVLAVAAIML